MGCLGNSADGTDDDSRNSKSTHFHAQLYTAGNADPQKIPNRFQAVFPLVFPNSDKPAECTVFHYYHGQHNKYQGSCDQGSVTCTQQFKTGKPPVTKDE